MLHFDENSAECLVFTFREGLLSAVAHDLEIRVGRFSVDVDPERRSVAARFDASSLRVVCAMTGDAEAPDTLSPANKVEIEANIALYVLEPAKYPEIRFVSRAVEDRPDSGFAIDGALSLHGVERPLRIEVRRGAEHDVAEARLQQTDFGIRPYTAMLGALRVGDRVVVRLVLPVAERS